jgi:DNA polymerase
MKLWLDTETRSRIPLKRGLAPYAEDVQVMVVTWAPDNEAPRIDDIIGGCDLTALRYAARHADEIWAHVAEFDMTMLNRQPWWQELNVPLEKWRCTATLARLHGLPGGLDKLSTILKMGDLGKDKAGKELIQLFCVPKPDGAYNDQYSHPFEWAVFLMYAGQDIVSMREAYRLLPKWNSTPRMWAQWHLDMKMNARGVAFDVEFAERMVVGTKEAKKVLADRTEELTDGEVLSTTQRNRLLAYFAAHGVTLPDLTADTVERRLADESIPETLKELLRVRQQASKASTAKYQRVLTHHVRGRLRNMLLFCGAARTGRWSGRIFQPQNLPRPKHKQWEIDQFISMAKAGGLSLYTPGAMLGLASSSLRGLMISADGTNLVVADLANIEGRDMAWMAGEEWKLDAFRDFDLGLGSDLYRLAIIRSFNKPESWFDWDDEVAQWRQIGKVMELSLQYYGGVGAFCNMADTYGLDLDALADAAWDSLPYEIKARAAEDWQKAGRRNRRYGLEQKVWIVCQSLVLLWRAAHPAIVGFWYALENAVLAAIRVPDHVISVGRVQVDRRGAWLRIRLPSGRYLCYPAAKLDEHSVSFVGINPYTKQWTRIGTYSGKLAENIVQASSADILMDGLLAADAAGYNPVLSVHDEIICESPDSPLFTDKGLSAIMTQSSPWAAGLPLVAKGFTSKRYKK